MISPYAQFYGGGWQDNPSTATPVIAAALQNMENGILAAGNSGGLLAVTQYAPVTQTLLSTTSASMVAVSSANVNTGSFVPQGTSAIVTVQVVLGMSSASQAVALGLADHGTLSMRGSSIQGKIADTFMPVTYSFWVTGLTAGTAYNFDLTFCVQGAATATIYAFSQTTSTPTLGNAGAGSPVLMMVWGV